MKSRPLEIEDVKYLDELHDKYFGHQFSKCDFTKNFLCSFVLTDDNDKIVMGGGIRPLAETVLVTDKSANKHLLGEALLQALQISKYTCNKYNIELLNVFIKDPVYMKHLIKHGFHLRDSHVLDMRV